MKQEVDVLIKLNNYIQVYMYVVVGLAKGFYVV